MQSKSNAKIMQRIRLQLNPCRRNAKQQTVFMICTFDTVTGRCLQVTVRRILQVQYLVQFITEQYGGHIIPVLDLNNVFVMEQDSESDLLVKVGQYLNDLTKNPHCNRDSKLYQFIFQQQVRFPNIERYDKMLSDAAVLSRRYLNTIFTRKQYGEVQAQDKDMLCVYDNFKNFSTIFRAVREIILVSARQQSYLEQIYSSFREIRGGIGQGLPPIEFVPVKMQKKLIKLQKLILQGEQAYTRWQVLRETVRELQCNIYKGLHEEHDYYKQKIHQLKKWTKSLMNDMKELISRGGDITEEHSRYLCKCKKEQAAPFGQQELPEFESEGEPEPEGEGGEEQKEKVAHQPRPSLVLLPRRRTKHARRLSQN